jgi:hypothetical protein
MPGAAGWGPGARPADAPGVRRLVTSVLLALVACGGLAAVPAGASAACAGEEVRVVDAAAAERTMLCLVNAYRVANGRAPLVLDARLARAARLHAADMVARSYFAHDTPEGLDPSDRARREGFPSGAGENIAWSTSVTPLSMFEQWRTSPGHNQNMLYASYNVVGTGFALGNPSGASYAGRGATGVQDFGRLASVPADGETGLGDPAGTPVTAPPAAATTPLTATPPATAPRRCAAGGRVEAARQRLAAARRRAARAHGRHTRAVAERRVRAARRMLARARAAANPSCR